MRCALYKRRGVRGRQSDAACHARPMSRGRGSRRRPTTTCRRRPARLARPSRPRCEPPSAKPARHGRCLGARAESGAAGGPPCPTRGSCGGCSSRRPRPQPRPPPRCWLRRRAPARPRTAATAPRSRPRPPRRPPAASRRRPPPRPPSPPARARPPAAAGGTAAAAGAACPARAAAAGGAAAGPRPPRRGGFACSQRQERGEAAPRGPSHK
mmetsp:Transcript_12857/g.37010  ORF Transcript_12857/g.37010 Transcript_12857/m.37010 type:complete len:211 (-) Transcript_12857:260-892(-)